MNKLFYELESEYLTTKHNLLNSLYNHTKYMTIQNLLELGFNNNYLNIKKETNGLSMLVQLNLGYKDTDGKYYSEDFSLNEKQLNCKVCDFYDCIDGDGYTIMYATLKNKTDAKYFIDKKGENI